MDEKFGEQGSGRAAPPLCRHAEELLIVHLSLCLPSPSSRKKRDHVTAASQNCVAHRSPLIQSQAEHSTDHELGYSSEQQTSSLMLRALLLLRAKGSLPCSAPVPACPLPNTPHCLQGGEKVNPFHPFDHVVNADVTLVIDVVRIIFLLAFLVFLKSSSSSNRSCRQKVTAHQNN